MTRDDAFGSIQANIENENLINHMLATEAIMRALARRLDQVYFIPQGRGGYHDLYRHVAGGCTRRSYDRGCHPP